MKTAYSKTTNNVVLMVHVVVGVEITSPVTDLLAVVTVVKADAERQHH